MDAQPELKFNDDESIALLETRLTIAKAMGAKSLVCQGVVLDIETAQHLFDYVKEKAGW